jgi:hypothetical protein
MEGRGAAPLEELLASLRRLHAPGRYGEPTQDREYRELGERILTEFYKKQEGSFTAPLFVEKSFLLEIGDVLLKGVVDRADSLEGGGVEIVDYKSGKPKEKLSSEDQLQLRLYAQSFDVSFVSDLKQTRCVSIWMTIKIQPVSWSHVVICFHQPVTHWVCKSSRLDAILVKLYDPCLKGWSLMSFTEASILE